MNAISGNLPEIREWLTLQLSTAPVVDVGEWQAQRMGSPQETTIEVGDVSFETPLPAFDVELWQTLTQANLPWAEEHFQERVSGEPLNPPPSHIRWPFAQADNKEHRLDDKFSHTYPERMWASWFQLKGIRFHYGDLAHVVGLLDTRPSTRQAFLPIWFPEDLGAASKGERVPCTLGYHFLIRNGHLKIVYYMRSCDFFRHFNDDVYMAGRLAQWVAEQVQVTPAKLVMHISSLHIFGAERTLIRDQASEIINHRMIKAW
jgi:thymidylate synthase